MKEEDEVEDEAEISGAVPLTDDVAVTETEGVPLLLNIGEGAKETLTDPLGLAVAPLMEPDAERDALALGEDDVVTDREGVELPLLETARDTLWEGLIDGLDEMLFTHRSAIWNDPRALW